MKRRGADGLEPDSKAFKFQSSAPSEERQSEFAHALHALNTQFSNWVAGQAEDHEGELWIAGVEDYLKHARGLLSEFGDVVAAAGAATGAAEPLPTRSIAERLSRPAADGASAPAAGSGGGLFPALKPIATGTFGAPAPASSAFGGAPAPSLFGAPPASGAAAASAPAFSWGAAAAASQPASGGLFSITASVPAAPAAVAAAAAAEHGNEADEAAPQVFKSEVVIGDAEAELLFKSRCRLYLQKAEDKSWADRGMGTLTVRQPKGATGGGYIVFTMESGRVLLNARLYKNMRVNQQPNKGSHVMMVLPVTSEGGAGQTLTLFRLPSADRGDEFAALCRDRAPK